MRKLMAIAVLALMAVSVQANPVYMSPQPTPLPTYAQLRAQGYQLCDIVYITEEQCTYYPDQGPECLDELYVLAEWDCQGTPATSFQLQGRTYTFHSIVLTMP